MPVRGAGFAPNVTPECLRARFLNAMDKEEQEWCACRFLLHVLQAKVGTQSEPACLRARVFHECRGTRRRGNAVHEVFSRERLHLI